MGYYESPAVSGVRQRGASLVVTLVMLVVLMLMGVSAIVVSNTQFRMAANLQFQNLAMSNAESALAQAENWIAANINDPGFTTRSPGGLYPVGTAPDAYTMSWDDSSSVRVDALGSQRYMVELLIENRVLPSNSLGNCNVYGQSAPCPRVNVYRLTSRGSSILGAVKMVQSIFAVRINV
jgi:Tfp pilus assembly protein PilX